MKALRRHSKRQPQLVVKCCRCFINGQPRLQASISLVDQSQAQPNDCHLTWPLYSKYEIAFWPDGIGAYNTVRKVVPMAKFGAHASD